MQRIWWISIFFFFIILNVTAQDQQGDMQQLASKINIESKYSSVRKVKWMDSKSKSRLIKYNPVNVVFSGLMFGYQKFLSPQLAASCVYAPSCSNFSKQLMKEYGLFKGIFLTADRITRCNRVAISDVSPLSIDERTMHARDDVMNFKFHPK